MLSRLGFSNHRGFLSGFMLCACAVGLKSGKFGTACFRLDNSRIYWILHSLFRFLCAVCCITVFKLTVSWRRMRISVEKKIRRFIQKRILSVLLRTTLKLENNSATVGQPIMSSFLDLFSTDDIASISKHGALSSWSDLQPKKKTSK